MKVSTFLQDLKVEAEALQALIEESKNPHILRVRKLTDNVVTRYYKTKKGVSDFRDTVVTTTDPLQIAFLVLDTASPIALSISQRFLDSAKRAEVIKEKAYLDSQFEIAEIITRADTFLRVLAIHAYHGLQVGSLAHKR